MVISNLTITELNFDALDRKQNAALNVDVGQILPTGPITVSQQRLTASLAGQKRVADVKGLKADPPPIFHSDTPAILVQTNGKATFAAVQNAEGLSFVVNTNWDILQTDADKTLYLRDDKSWLTATALSGPWSAVTTLPDALSSLPSDNDNWKDARAAIPATPFKDGAPKVFYSDTPAELLLFDGSPKAEAVPDTNLEWMSNTESDVFFDNANTTWYVLLSGRWFSAASLDGPWTFATPNLPDDFSKLPADTPYYSVRYSVPGTSESDQARLKASIPNTARVEVDKVKADVSYAGDPQFTAIEGTSMSYATNTNTEVIEVDGRYFVLQDGVWFVGDAATGPWAVATSVPEVIYTIPPSSPVYRTTYVRVYDTEPGAVWFGYTMGYLTGYLAWGTYVYGTGWYYPPVWYAGARGWPGYFPRPVTYGMGAYYNPVRGTYGRYGYAYGPYRGIAYGSAYNPRTGTYVRGGAADGPWGGRGFVSAYNPRTNTGAFARGGHDIYGSWGTAGVRRGSSWARVSGAENGNAGAMRWRTSAGNSGFVGGRDGNLYAGRDGNVYRHTDNGWQKYDRGDGWSSAGRQDGRPGADRPANRPAADRPAADRPAADRPANRPGGRDRPRGEARTGSGPERRPAAAAPRPRAESPRRVPEHLSQDRRGREMGNVNGMRERNIARGGGREFRGGGREFRGGGGFHGGGGGFRGRR